MRRLYGGVAFLVCAAIWLPASAQSLAELGQMSITQLANIDVSSVTKSPQSLSSAPGAVYVITADQIRRSGAETIPEILRLAPNLQVYQVNGHQWVITARGLSGNLTDQNFSNKLLVLIDGRTVYSPLYSGVYWDMQSVPVEDIDRIEVISGPGATLWGANAVNGVINIITRPSAQTQGGFASITAGTQMQAASLQYGGTLGPDATWRVYAGEQTGDDTPTSLAHNGHDHWTRPQGGFHLNWTASSHDHVMIEGDLLGGSNATGPASSDHFLGADLLARWNHDWDDGQSLQVLAYYDHASRRSTGEGHFVRDSFDLEAQHSFTWLHGQAITWGGGIRVSPYTITGNPSFYFVPASRALTLANMFVQDRVALGETVSAIAGIKLEDDPYTGLAVLPSLRLAWQPRQEILLWSAISRAVRSPTPFDRDVIERVPGVSLIGNPTLQSATLTAYEIGTRMQPARRLSFSLSAFYNAYDDLRSIDLSVRSGVLQIEWANGLRGNSYGAELWGNYQVSQSWQISASFTELREDFGFKPGHSVALGTQQLGDDPEETARLGSTISLSSALNLDAGLRYVSALPNPHVPAYVEMDASIGWKLTKRLHLTLSGLNLLHARHQEWPAAQANAVPRSVALRLDWWF